MASSTQGFTLQKTITLPGSLGGHGDWVAYDAPTQTVWLAQSPDNNVVVIDANTNTIKAVIPDIGNGNVVAFTPQYAFVTDPTNNTTDVIDKGSYQLVAKVPQTGTSPDGAVYIPTTGQVAVASDDNNSEDFLNATAPFVETKSIQLLPSPANSGPDVGTYVPSKDLLYQPDDQQIDVINPHTGSIVATWNLVDRGTVKPMVYDPITDRFLVGTTNNKLLVIDGSNGTVLKTIAISGSVDEGTIDVSERLAFFGDKAGVVDIIDLNSDQLIGGLPAEKNMHTLGVDPATHDVYVYENNRNTVDVFTRHDPTHARDFGATDHDGSSAGGELYAIYDGLLGRGPDLLGLEGYAVALKAGVSLHDIAQSFLDSPEGRAHFGTVDNGTFVEELYQTALHRHSDPNGFNTYTDALNNGTSRADVALSIVLSNEHFGDLNNALSAGIFVPDQTESNLARLYYGILERTPDKGGFEFNTQAAAGGVTLQDQAKAMLSSDEYKALTTGFTDAGYVEHLYSAALGRHSDPGGLSTYTNALMSGQSRADVANAILDSSEYQNAHVSQSNASYVESTYLAGLGRHADPDGLSTYTNALDSGLSRQALNHILTSSPEFQSHYVQPDDRTFVDQLFVGALGRHAESAGMQHYLNDLQHGVSRAQVALSISESPEAQQHHLSDIEQGWHLI